MRLVNSISLKKEFPLTDSLQEFKRIIIAFLILLEQRMYQGKSS